MSSTAVDVGTQAPAREFGPMTRQMFVRYSGASGDLNPMHYDDGFARRAGYPSVFSQGMHVAALLATYATDWLGAENVRRFHVRFREQIFPDDIVTCRGTVTAVQPEGDGRRIHVDLTAERQDGAVAIMGEAEFVLP
jgi:acyl dehydratase